MKAIIIWIEAKRAEGPSFILGLRKKGYQVETVTTGSEALARLADLHPHLVVLNAASLRTNGKRICRSLRERVNGLPIVVITDKLHPPPEDLCANVVLELPFTQRKLLNRIKPFLPSDIAPVLEKGAIRLDLARRMVRVGEREIHLTPRLTELLRILLEHAGEAVERSKLFGEAWKTDYLEDTRTLDVHISWLRAAIEPDPRKPIYLKTVRGVGYRLDV